MNRSMFFGLVQLAIAGVLAIITALLVWGSVTRWVGISHIVDARARMRDSQDESAKRHAKLAAESLPNEPAAVLLDIDLTSEADFKRLQRLEGKCATNLKPLVQVAESLSLVLRGQPAGDAPGADGALLTLLADAMKSGRPSPLPSLPKDAPPHQAVLAMTLVAELRAALKAGDRARVRESAGALGLLLPAHPQGPMITFICAALDPDFDQRQFPSLVQRIKDKGQLVEVTRALGRIAPDRARLLDSISLGLSMDLPEGQVLKAQVDAAAAGGAVDVQSLARRCFESGHPELAKPLLPKLPPEVQPSFRRAILNQEGDLLALAASGDPVLVPRLAPARCRPGLVAFHLSNDLGLVPKSAVTVRLNGNDVPAGKVRHTGSLYSAETELSGAVDLEVRVGDKAIFTGKVFL
jgi:hypothetical protein